MTCGTQARLYYINMSRCVWRKKFWDIRTYRLHLGTRMCFPDAKGTP